MGKKKDLQLLLQEPVYIGFLVMHSRANTEEHDVAFISNYQQTLKDSILNSFDQI